MLDDETWKHIREFHPEITDFEMIEKVLQNPDWIVQSNWDLETYLYYKRVRPKRYLVIVVQLGQNRIKTTLTTDRIKDGEVIWPKTKFMP